MKTIGPSRTTRTRAGMLAKSYASQRMVEAPGSRSLKTWKTEEEVMEENWY